MEQIFAPNSAKPIYDLTIFFGGGITNCPDWQNELAGYLAYGPFTIWNPRRPSFPMNDPKQGRIQIKWELERLRAADINVYWFCKETLCPATLIEFGESCARRDLMIIGMDPAYERRFDIETRLALIDPLANDQVVYDLRALGQRILHAVGDVVTARKFSPTPFPNKATLPVESARNKALAP